MHRIAVDVHHWMTDKQFADVFAISQLSPGPNVLIVTLIGYSVAGIFGALAATLAMCGPTAVLAYYVSRLLARSSGSRWPAMIQAALVPLSIGLMGASALILVLTSDGNWIAALITVAAAALAFATRLNPFWMRGAQGVVYLSLKLIVRAERVARRKRIRFHDVKNRLSSDYRYFAYARFLSTTREVERTPLFEIERRLI